MFSESRCFYTITNVEITVIIYSIQYLMSLCMAPHDETDGLKYVIIG